MVKPITTKVLAQATGMSPQTIRRLERRGLIRAVRDYRGWRQFAPSEANRLRALLGWDVLRDGAEREARHGAEPSRSRRSPTR